MAKKYLSVKGSSTSTPAKAKEEMSKNRAMPRKLELSNALCDALGVERMNREIGSLNRYESCLLIKAVAALKAKK